MQIEAQPAVHANTEEQFAGYLRLHCLPTLSSGADIAWPLHARILAG
jgi:hypothetical protein